MESLRYVACFDSDRDAVFGSFLLGIRTQMIVWREFQLTSDEV